MYKVLDTFISFGKNKVSLSLSIYLYSVSSLIFCRNRHINRAKVFSGKLYLLICAAKSRKWVMYADTHTDTRQINQQYNCTQIHLSVCTQSKMLNRLNNCLKIQLTDIHSAPNPICKSPEVSFYGSVVIYMLLILSVRPIGADRGHLASSASVLWEIKDLSLMFL